MEENLADALKMAAFVLIFVGALSIAISSFSNIRMASNSLVLATDREYERNEEDAYIEFSTSNVNRVVSEETIIPTIMRSYIERYRVVFDSTCGIGPLYRVRDSVNFNTYVDMYYIDLETQAVGGEEEKIFFLMMVLYGENHTKKMYGEAETAALKSKMEQNYHIEFVSGNGMFSKISGKTYTEYVGVYYSLDIDEVLEGGADFDSVPDAQKMEKRIITYFPN